MTTVSPCRLIDIVTGDERPTTRERLLDATVSLMRTKGAAASGTKEILELADAPRGSFYFHFPGGKDQLVLEAMDRAAAATLALVQRVLADDDGDLADQVGAIFAAVEAELVAEDYAPGCAVGVTTLESSATSPIFQQAASRAFTSWTSTLAGRFVERGVPADRADMLADAVVAGMEGATLLARAQRNPAPLRRAADALAIVINSLRS